jgi:hypothetical protein
MRARLPFAIAFSIAMLSPALTFPAEDAGSAKAFLISVYRHYQNGGKGIDSTGPRAGLYYHSSLLTLMRADEKAASPDIGADDGDPTCGCQDWDGIWDLKIDLHFQTPHRAQAIVTFALSAPKDRPKDAFRKLAITLVPEHGQWRIYDTVDETDPGAPFDLRGELQRDIDSHQHRP